MKLARRRRRRLRRCVTSRSEWVVSAQVESVTPVVSSASSAPDHPQGKVDGMVLIQRCCCISLRIGSYASAVYTMLYFIVTIIMVGIFGVVDTNPSLMNLDSLNLTSMYDGIWLPVFDGNSYKNNATWTLDDHIGVVDIDTSQTHLSSASHVLSICVLALSSLGLASTFLLLFALVKKRRNLLLPWVCTVICTTSVDYVYAVYLLFNNLDFLNLMTATVFAGDFLLVLINVCAIICVISQYQELHREINQQRTSLGVFDMRLSEGNQPLEEIKLSEMAQHTHHCHSTGHDLIATTVLIDG